MSKSLSSRRAQAREAARQRRIKSREWERTVLDLVAAGYAYDEIANKAGASVAAIKRCIQRAIRQRPPEPAETFVALQRERLNKALQHTDLAMGRGDLRAVAALVSLMPQLERYWGLQNALQTARGSVSEARLMAPNPLKSLEAKTALPPLAADEAPLPAERASQSSSAAASSTSSNPPSP